MDGEAILGQRVSHQRVVGGERLGDGEQLVVLLHGVGAPGQGDRVDLQAVCAQVVGQFQGGGQPVHVAAMHAHDHLEAQSLGAQVLNAPQRALERPLHPAQVVVQQRIRPVNGDREPDVVLLERPGLARADQRAVGLHAQAQAHLAQRVENLDHLRVQERLAAGDLDRAQADFLRLLDDALQIGPGQVLLDLAAEDRINPAVAAVEVARAGDVQVNLAQRRDALRQRRHGQPPGGSDGSNRVGWRG